MVTKKKAGLGRGLSAILGEVEEAYQNDLNDSSGLVVEIDINKIKPNPLQPRKIFDEESLKELAQSIEEHGLLQPILVYEDTKNPDEYYLIAGERRLRASKIANKQSIKVIIADVKEDKLRELALIENIQREDLNPIDLAHSYKELIEDYGITHEEVAKRLSKSRAQITNTLRLLELDSSVQKDILENKISQGHAKMLVTLSKENQRLVADSVIGQKLSVHETEKIVKNLKENTSFKLTPKNNKKEAPQNQDLTKAIQEVLGILSQKKFKVSQNTNKLIVEFRNNDEVRKFLNILPN
ncbi:MAG: ParB/RepB/Spo0J family partition protein [Helicobacter sp.]|nr:ParB/RepB/Spo0J family partition protein [Helicobacter sp.]